MCIQYLQKYCDQFIEMYPARFTAFKESMKRDSVVSSYVDFYAGLPLIKSLKIKFLSDLDRILFIVDEWARGLGVVLSTPHFRPNHLAQLFIMFATNSFAFLDANSKIQIQLVNWPLLINLD